MRETRMTRHHILCNTYLRSSIPSWLLCWLSARLGLEAAVSSPFQISVVQIRLQSEIRGCSAGLQKKKTLQCGSKGCAHASALTRRTSHSRTSISTTAGLWVQSRWTQETALSYATDGCVTLRHQLITFDISASSSITFPCSISPKCQIKLRKNVYKE